MVPVVIYIPSNIIMDPFSMFCLQSYIFQKKFIQVCFKPNTLNFGPENKVHIQYAQLEAILRWLSLERTKYAKRTRVSLWGQSSILEAFQDKQVILGIFRYRIQILTSGYETLHYIRTIFESYEIRDRNTNILRPWMPFHHQSINTKYYIIGKIILYYLYHESEIWDFFNTQNLTYNRQTSLRQKDLIQVFKFSEYPS